MKLKFSFDYYMAMLTEFSQIKETELRQMAENGDSLSYEYGKKIDFNNFQQMLDYYSQLPLLCAYIRWHLQLSHGRRKAVANKLHGNVLNYGCGIATESLMANVERGVKSDLIDLDTTTKGFTKFIIESHNLKNIEYISTLDISQEQYATGKKYDFIVCLDVLEHLQMPDNLLLWFRNILKPLTGKLIIRAPFHIDNDPSHIQDHNLKVEDLLKEAYYEPFQYEIVDV